MADSPFNKQKQPLSSFQQWKLEEDRKFYETFPQARPVENQYTFQPAQDYFGGAGFEFNLAGTYTHTTLAEDHYSAMSSPAHSRGESSLSPALHFNYGNESSSPSHVYSIQSRVPNNPVPTSGHNPAPPTLPGTSVPVSQPYHSHSPVVDVQNCIMVPSQPPCPSPVSQPEPPIMDYLPSPSSPAPPSHIRMTHRPSLDRDALQKVLSDQWRLPDNIDTPWQYEPSSVVRTDDPAFSSHPLLPTRHLYHPVRSYPQFSPGGHGIQPPGWPMLEKKPPLACLFCRGRKIACGPPDPGSEDPTCNQCQRRSIKCEYPSESRRGMRRKKSVGVVNTAGPKVRVGKRARSDG